MRQGGENKERSGHWVSDITILRGARTKEDQYRRQNTAQLAMAGLTCAWLCCLNGRSGRGGVKEAA